MSKPIILLAVSGGLDSMVMLHRMHTGAGVKELAVAHCNFKLRNEESDGDALFVKESCAQLGIRFHSKDFDTSSFAHENGIGTQEAARELRYNWFFELLTEYGYQELATAHHQDDSIETFFINLIRGSGPRGLSGIQNDPARQIVRPMMDMDRDAIAAYAKDHNVSWREDRSNKETNYLRNKLRHELLPPFCDLRQGFKSVMLKNMAIQESVSALLEDMSQLHKAAHFKHEGTDIRIERSNSPHEALFLWQLLKPYGFSSTQLENILASVENGKRVNSKHYSLSVHQNDLLLSETKDLIESEWTIEEDLDTGFLPIDLKIEAHESTCDSFDPNPCLAYLDREKLCFPLTVRHWRDGDRFKALGMQGNKLISDFLSDLKIPLEKRKKVLLLISEDQIAWVIGYRISDSFKASSGPMLKLKLSS